MDLAEARRQFPILSERTYLFSGGHSPACSAARAAAQRLMDEWTFEIADLYGRLREEQDIVRGLFADLIGASVDEVAIVESTGMGSKPRRRDDRAARWRQRGIRRVELPVKHLPLDAAGAGARREAFRPCPRRTHRAGRPGWRDRRRYAGGQHLARDPGRGLPAGPRSSRGGRSRAWSAATRGRGAVCGRRSHRRARAGSGLPGCRRVQVAARRLRLGLLLCGPPPPGGDAAPRRRARERRLASSRADEHVRAKARGGQASYGDTEPDRAPPPPGRGWRYCWASGWTGWRSTCSTCRATASRDCGSAASRC